MEAVISANRFLDLLCCVIPAASCDETRPYICAVQLEVMKKDYAIRAVATDGTILSMAKRELGFSRAGQADLEDFEAREKVSDATWILSRIDAELLIISLKKLGVKRKEEDDETGGRYYIVIREEPVEKITEDGEVMSKRKLSISILGLSHVVLEPTLVNQEYPNWKGLIPTEKAETSYIGFNLGKLALLHKCWGSENIFISFLSKSQVTKVVRDTEDHEKREDFIILMPLRKDENKDNEKLDNNQRNFFENDQSN